MLFFSKLGRGVCGLLAGAVICVPTIPGSAQDGTCRLVHTTTEPALDVLQCPSGPTVTSESASDVRVFDPSKRGQPASAAVSSGAALIDVPPGYPPGFQVVMPRAVASVRGTRWAVDVSEGQTSVVVLRGEVSVARPTGGGPVVLHRGEGVDVGDDGAPLRVTRWPDARVARLMARLGMR